MEILNTKIVHWKDVAEILGIATVVISLLLVFQELRQNQTIARAQLNMAQLDLIVGLNHREMDGEFSRVWVKSRTEPTNLTLVERHQIDAFLHSVLGLYRRELANYRLGIFEEWESLIDESAAYYFGIGYGRTFWNELRGAYNAAGDAEFVDVVDAAVSNEE